MIKKLILLISSLVFTGALTAHAQDEIKLIVPNFKPYTFEEDGRIQGIGVELVEKIMKKVGVLYSLELAPNYGRAVEQTRIGQSDGFFLASKNAERDAIAVFSEPIAVNRWSWFLPAKSQLNPKDPTFKTSARIGTHMNTNTHKWLKKEGYTVTVTPNSVNVLPDMILKYNRADAIFLAEVVFIDVAQRNGISTDKYRQVVEIAKPFGMYIAKNYLLKNPGFMKRLNKAIKEVKK